MPGTGLSVRRLLVMVLGLSGIAPMVSAQSLADVAREEQARRRAIAHPSKVYSNADVRPDPLSVPPSLLPLPPAAKPQPAPQPKEAEQRNETAKRAPAQPAANVFSPWQVWQPTLRIPTMGPTRGVNTPREQAMSNYMRDAGHGSPPAPEQPGVLPAPR